MVIFEKHDLLARASFSSHLLWSSWTDQVCKSHGYNQPRYADVPAVFLVTSTFFVKYLHLLSEKEKKYSKVSVMKAIQK